MPRRPRRNEKRFLPDKPKPASTYDEAKRREPRPTTYTDRKGRVWTVDYLLLREGRFGTGVYPWDATHLGFAFAPVGGEVHQRVYRFQRGDDRSLNPEAIFSALAASKRVPTHAEHAHKKLLERLSRAPTPTMTERIQELYSGRRGGMGRR